MTSPAARRWVPFVLVLLTAFLAWNRIRLTRGLEYFDPANPDCFFWTEGAVQYRYARMVAEGTPIPERDTALQWPEGIRPRDQLCLLMERSVGASYRAFGRLFGRPPFHVWAAFAPHVVAAIGVPAAYLAGAAVWGGALGWGAAAGGTQAGAAAGLLAAALYAFSLATVGRAIGSFGHEDFALPWLFLAAAFLLRIARGGAPASERGGAAAPMRSPGRSVLDGALAASALVLGLASWQFSRFVFLLLVIALGTRLLFAESPGRERIARALLWAAGAALAAGLGVSVLRETRFLLSPSVLLAVAVLAAYAIDARIPRSESRAAAGAAPGPAAAQSLGRIMRRAALAALALATLLGATRLVSRAETDDYAHVYALLLAKVRFLGAKPADPQLLAPEARSLWIEDFSSPSAYLVAAMFGIPLALAAAALVARRRGARGPSSAPTAAPNESFALLIALVVLSGGSFLLVKRLFVVFAFFLAALAGGAASFALASARVRARGVARIHSLAAALLVAALGLEAYKVYTHGRDTAVTRTLRAFFPRKAEALTIPNWHANDLATVAWIRNHTEPGAAFVGRIGSSPMVLTYADRPIVLQPKYEVPAIRERARALDAALYGSEADLYRFCRDHRATYYLHESRVALEPGPDSERYVGCATQLGKSSAAFRLQFAGEASRYFRPLYRNLSYLVYRVVDPADTAEVGAAAPLPPQPLCEIARFGGQTLDGEFFDDAATPRVLGEMERAIALLVAAQGEIGAQRYDRAQSLLEQSRALAPSLPGVNTYLGLALALRGDYRNALPLCAQEIAISPDLPLAYANLGFVEGNLAMYNEARAHLERAIALDPANGGARAMLAQVEAAARSVGARAEPGASSPPPPPPAPPPK